MIRAIILAATIAALVCLYLDRQKPVKAAQVDYCWVTYRAAGKDELGRWRYGWAQGFGPCSLLDRYEQT